MTKPRFITVSLAALSVAACAEAPLKINTTTRLEANPLAFYQNPTLKAELSHSYITNEAELESAARRIEAEALEAVDDEAETSTSARSNISLL